MALPERVSRDWRSNRGVIHTYNNITYSIKNILSQLAFNRFTEITDITNVIDFSAILLAILL